MAPLLATSTPACLRTLLPFATLTVIGALRARRTSSSHRCAAGGEPVLNPPRLTRTLLLVAIPTWQPVTPPMERAPHLRGRVAGSHVTAVLRTHCGSCLTFTSALVLQPSLRSPFDQSACHLHDRLRGSLFGQDEWSRQVACRPRGNSSLHPPTLERSRERNHRKCVHLLTCAGRVLGKAYHEH